jgi:hypothetical protein
VSLIVAVKIHLLLNDVGTNIDWSIIPVMYPLPVIDAEYVAVYALVDIVVLSHSLSVIIVDVCVTGPTVGTPIVAVLIGVPLIVLEVIVLLDPFVVPVILTEKLTSNEL